MPGLRMIVRFRSSKNGEIGIMKQIYKLRNMGVTLWH